ncbi:MAG TPA: hypothetical protein VJ810_32795 [Blastocatellia bacterium]|nr:hypothetical protein [Blastocatellia bacterium]
MKNSLRIVAIRLIPALLIVALCSVFLERFVNARVTFQEDTQTRRLWDSEFVKPKKAMTAKRRYRVATPRIPTDKVDGESVLGITLWRLRPSRGSDDKQVRLFKHKKDDTNVLEWTPERISVDTPLAAGQRVRLSIEAARTGYLYVIDREMYEDGTLGDPYLIFPTSNLRGGDNQVSVGRVIDIPALDDEPYYYTLDPDRPGLTGEMISVLVTPQPLDDIKIGEKMIKLSKDHVEKWEKSWGAQVGRLELENSFGNAWTKEEREASNGQTLKRDGPAPQTLYYRPAAKPGDSLMVSVRLRYGTVRAKAQ